MKKIRERYQALTELTSDAVINLNLKGIVTSCNPALLKLSGYTQQDIIGHHFSELPLLPQEEIPRYEKLFAALLKGEIPPPFATQWIDAHGSPHSGHVYVVLIREDGQPAAIQVIAKDITIKQHESN